MLEVAVVLATRRLLGGMWLGQTTAGVPMKSSKASTKHHAAAGLMPCRGWGCRAAGAVGTAQEAKAGRSGQCLGSKASPAAWAVLAGVRAAQHGGGSSPPLGPAELVSGHMGQADKE